MADGLRSASSASIQVITASVGSRGLGFVRVLVTARLLEPADFGRFVLVLAILGGFETATQPGLTTAIVQARSITGEQCAAIWTILAVRGALVSAGLMACAPWLSSTFGTEDAGGLLAAAGLSFALRGLTSVEVHRAMRDADFRPHSLSILVGSIVETVVAIAAVVVVDSAAGLVIGLLAGAATEALTSHLVARGGSKASLRWSEARPLLGFSRWVFAGSALQYVSNSADDLLLGRSAGSAVLARYSVAYRIASTPTTEVSHTLSRVALPLIARRQDDPELLDASFSRYLAVVTALAAPLAVLIATCSTSITAVVLGRAWDGAAGPLAVLAVAGGLRAVAATGGNLFTGLGRPRVAAGLLLVRAVALLIGLAILIPDHGATGAAFASVISLVAMLVALAAVLPTTTVDRRLVASSVLRRGPVTFLVGLGSWSMTLVTDPGIVELILASSAGLMAWALGTWYLDRPLVGVLEGQWRSLRTGAGTGADAGTGTGEDRG